MRSALEELVVLLKDEHTISSFELYNSGLVQTMLSILSTVSAIKSYIKYLSICVVLFSFMLNNCLKLQFV